MRVTVLVGVIGALLGYLIGFNHQEGKQQTEPVSEERSRSSRRLVGKREQAKRDSSGRKSSLMQQERVAEWAKMGRRVSGVDKARLIHWIMELEAGDFPDVLKTLGQIRGQNIDPFSDGYNQDFFSLGLVRWYELEGDLVTGWFLANEESMEGREVGSLLGEMIYDRFSRDPGGALAELERYAGVMKEGGYWYAANWAQSLGRWSQDAIDEFETIRALAEEFGVKVQDPDPFASEESSYLPVDKMSSEELEEILKPALARGLIEAGRIDEARELVSGNGPKLGRLVEKAVQEQKLTSLQNSGWRELKGFVESGELKGNATAERKVLEAWSGEDPDAAVEWYLDQSEGPEGRGRRIAEVVDNWGAIRPESGGLRWPEISSRMVEFLNQQDSQGERTTEGWDELAAEALNYDDWNIVFDLREKVSEQYWNYTVEKIKGLGEKDRVFLGEDRLEFRTLHEAQLETLEKFGLKEEVQDKVDIQNQKSFQRLGELLNRE